MLGHHEKLPSLETPHNTRKRTMSDLEKLTDALTELDPSLDKRIVHLVGQIEGTERLREIIRVLREVELMRNKPNQNKKQEETMKKDWVAIESAYGDWKLVGHFETYREAKNAATEICGLELPRVTRVRAGYYELGNAVVCTSEKFDASWRDI